MTFDKKKYNREWVLHDMAKNPEKYQRKHHAKMDSLRKNPAKYIIFTKRRRARYDGIDFTLGVEDILPLPEVCPLLGIPIDYDVRGKVSNNSPSVDRINNELGYVPGNVRVISFKANSMKRDLTIQEVRTLLGYMTGTSGLQDEYASRG